MNKNFIFLAILVAYLPFQIALNLAAGIDLMSGRVLILALLAAWCLTELWREKEAKPFLAGRRVLWTLALFFFVSAASIFGAVNQFWGWRKLLVFASIFPLFWLVSVLIRKKKELADFLLVVSGSAVAAALIALIQFLSQFIFGREAVMAFWAERVTPVFSGASFGALVVANPSWLVDLGGRTVIRAIGLFPDPHMLAFYLGLILPFSLAWAIFGERRRGFFLAASGLFLTVLLLTFSRGGYLGLIFSGLVFFWLAWPRLTVSGKKFFMAGFALAAAVFLLIGWPVAARLLSSFDLAEGSNSGRLAIWQVSGEIAKNHLVTGVGLGNYSLSVSFNQGYRNAVTSHNLYLDILAETGFFGLLAWLLVLATAACQAYKKRKAFPVAALGALAALAYFFGHSFFETAIFNPTVLAFLMVVLGLTEIDLKEDVL